jgi:hypothetical protein
VRYGKMHTRPAPAWKYEGRLHPAWRAVVMGVIGSLAVAVSMTALAAAASTDLTCNPPRQGTTARGPAHGANGTNDTNVTVTCMPLMPETAHRADVRDDPGKARNGVPPSHDGEVGDPATPHDASGGDAHHAGAASGADGAVSARSQGAANAGGAEAASGSVSLASLAPSAAEGNARRWSAADWSGLVRAILGGLAQLVAVCLGGYAAGLFAYRSLGIFNGLFGIGAVAAKSPDSTKSLDAASAPRPGHFAFTRHWGGFGGEATGWYLSRELMQLIIAFLLAVVAVVLALAVLLVAFGRGGTQTAPEARPAASASHATTAHE